MDLKQIRALAGIFQDAGLTRLEITEEQWSITMEKQAQMPVVISETALANTAASKIDVPAQELTEQPEPVDFNRVTEVKSPMVGVFYASPTPEADPYVKRGDRVKRGDVLCIIEAMKLMNEITADMDGEIADVCAENGQVVEFSQTLFKIC